MYVRIGFPAHLGWLSFACVGSTAPEVAPQQEGVVSEQSPVSARIISLHPETPSVVFVALEMSDPNFTFLPGQWIDLGVELEGEMKVGGYSPASTAGQLPRLELGVRYNPEHPVSAWLHHHARPGDEVWVQGGQGECVYLPAPGDDVVFIVGGIGITPPLSMLRNALSTDVRFSACLFYSVRSAHEVAFVSELAQFSRDARFSLQVTVTRDGHDQDGWKGHRGRWTVADILERADVGRTIFYVFGPPPMVDGMCDGLAKVGVAEDRIRTERWW